MLMRDMLGLLVMRRYMRSFRPKKAVGRMVPSVGVPTESWARSETAAFGTGDKLARFS